MKSLQIIFLQACLLIMAACGPKGPRVVQKEGFTLIYDTLAFDVSDIGFRSDFPLEFVNVVPLDDEYLCAFEQRKPGPYSPYPKRYLLRVDRETGKTHAVDFPERQQPHWNIKERDGEVYMVYPEWCDTMWRFIPEQEAWEDATEYRDVVYEDEDYRVYSRGMHYSPDQTWFLTSRQEISMCFQWQQDKFSASMAISISRTLHASADWPIRRSASYVIACLIMRQHLRNHTP